MLRSERLGPAAQSADRGTSDDSDEADAPTLEDLLELWPELLEELQQGEAAAFEAVRAVTPVSFDGEVLGVGIATGEELAAFKSQGAGPLREAILAATGITVKYMPKQIARAPREEAQAAGPQRDPDPEEPHRGTAPDAAPQPQDDPLARAEAKLSAFGPPQPAPAWAEPAPQAPDPEPQASPEDAGLPDEPSYDADAEPEPEPAESITSESTPAEPAPAEPPTPQKAAPAFTRYGEAVVREVLGARFIEERPLPQQGQG